MKVIKLILAFSLVLIMAGCGTVTHVNGYVYVRSSWRGYSCAVEDDGEDTVTLTRYYPTPSQVEPLCTALNRELDGHRSQDQNR